ncbi:transcriptional regulator [Sphingobacteriales bacterium UPWRP_1]|nr:transcriptional regulator [Sphingobacteriales bacterium TSM_CSS]PSJ75345.1 transcriptional regulator [Sphingobacteriales bacterium UPWRP_1]
MYAKTTHFTAGLQELALFAKAMSHPARIAIIQLLSEKKSCISGNIAQELPLSRSTVCQHLQELKDAGLIKGEISGQNVCYCLDTENIARLKHAFTQFLNHLDIPFINCPCS